MPAGRPRSEAAQRAILDATRAELTQHGYDKLSIDRIAASAGVSKPTIYRRYASKSALVAHCLLEGYVLTPALEVNDSGDIRDDLTTWVQKFVTITKDPQAVALIRAAGAAASEDRDIARGFQQQLNTLAREALAERLNRAEDAGQVRGGTPAETIAEVIVGALLYRLVTHEEVTMGFADDLTNTILNGILPETQP
ncbi:TetR/AcrR family transcriptional regulator [Leifsonia lichenia]